MKGFTKTAKLVAAVGMAAALTGCGPVIDEGNFGIEKYWGGEYNTQPLLQGWHFNIFDTIYEVYAREMMIPIENAQPKDRNKAKLQDLDINIMVRANPAKAVEFLLKTGDLTTDPNSSRLLLGRTILAKDAQSTIGETIKKFTSEEILGDKKTVEEAFKRDFQGELDKLYGPETFIVNEVKFGNILAADFIEQKQQAISLLNAEKEKNDATMAVLASRKDTLAAEAKTLSQAAEQGGITVDQLLTYETIKAIKETPNSQVRMNMDVKANNTPKPK